MLTDFRCSRKVDNVDFGFTFRTPARSRRSNSRTSNSSLHNAKRPSRRSRESSAAHSRRSTSKASDAEPEERASREAATRPNLQNIPSIKRRRLAPDATEDEPLAARPGPPRKTSSMFAIAEDPNEQGPLLVSEVDNDQRDHTGLLQSLPNGSQGKENTAPGTGKAPANRKKRRSVGQQNTRKKKRSSDSLTVPTDRLDDKHGTVLSLRAASPSLEKESEQGSRSFFDGDHSRLDETPSEISKLPSKRRKKRKSVVLVKSKRRSSEGVKSQSRRRIVTQGSPDQQSDEDEEQPHSPAERRNIHPPSSVSRSSPVMRSIEVNDASDEEYIDEEESPEPPTPASTKKAKTSTKASRASSSTLGPNTEQTRRSRKLTFPILTHRITNTEALPTIREEDEDEERVNGDDAFTSVHAISHRAAPNVADVLAQICRETIETTIERMETEAVREPRAIRQRKRAALEAFGADLDSRLLDVSAAAEDRLDLEARVRKVKRGKTDLQSRWLEVRSQRERVALRCDRLRREHWEDEQSREDRWMISEAARKAELKLEKDSPDEEEALEHLLRSVAEEVSGTAGGNLLNRMKSMNAQLEKMAGVLEGRAA